MTFDLSRLDAVAQAELVARGEVSALELVDAAIARIEQIEPKIHALASTDFDGARERAARGVSGPLGGVPFLAKDLLPIPGHRCAFGSRLFRSNVPTERSPYTDALEASGLILLGKTTTSEFGLLGSTETLLEGVTRNPWDVRRSALGSSGGSAAAVASGMVPIAHASDGGGFIGIPASGSGLFGFKPGRDRMLPIQTPSPRGFVMEHAVSRSVRDNALLYSLLEDRSSRAPIGYVKGPSSKRLRIGAYTRTLLGAEPDDAVRIAHESVVRLCKSLGHDVVETTAPPVDPAGLSDAFFVFAGAGMAAMAQGMSQALGRPVGSDDLEPFTLSLVAWFATLPPDAVERAFATMARAEAEMKAFLGGFDVLLCPTIPCLPYELGTLSPTLDRETLVRRTERLAGYTPIHSMAGLPAMSVPLSQSAEGLPIGSHFAANEGREDVLFALAYELEAAAPWRDSYSAIRL